MNNELPLNKEQILDAAEQVLRRFGPEKTSMMDVARALQVSHGALYRHYSSKASLREAVTERWLMRSIVQPLAEIANSNDGSTTTRLRLWLDTLVSSKRKYAAEDPEMFAMYASVTLEAKEIINSHVTRLLEQLTTIIETGILSGEFNAADPAETALAIFMATSRFHHPAHFGEWTMERVNSDFMAVWKLIIGGVSASKID